MSVKTRSKKMFDLLGKEVNVKSGYFGMTGNMTKTDEVYYVSIKNGSCNFTECNIYDIYENTIYLQD